MGLADFGEPAAANPACEKTREEVTWSASALGANAVVFCCDIRSGGLLARFDQVPECIVDDAQLRHLLDDPFRFRVESGLALSGIGIFDEVLPVPDEPADIEFVVEDARPPPQTMTRMLRSTLFFRNGSCGAGA